MSVGVVSVLMMSTGSAAAPPVKKAQLIATYPHDETAFCQGLVVHDGKLVEGTGQYARSRLRIVDLETGRPETEVRLGSDQFGEGITIWKDSILQLTWRNGYLLTWDATSLQQTGTIRYADVDRSWNEGWGITHNGHSLIVSDGTSALRYINPETWKLERTVKVRNSGRPLSKLNELEFVGDRILANVWYEDRIACINPESGVVEQWIDVSHLRPRAVRGAKESVLNGIAWDEKAGRLFVTGKHWPQLFEISVDGIGGTTRSAE